MNIYIFKAKHLFAGFLLMLLFLFIVFIFMSKSTIGVFSVKKEIPIYSVECAEKNVALTFDCAWGEVDIPLILDSLKRENVLATFFIVGQWAEKYPDTVRMIARDGHDIAAHGYSHLRMSTIDGGGVKSEMDKSISVLQGLAGKKVDLFRPPYGDYSDRVVRIAREAGCYTIQWNIDSLDWRPGISQQEILVRITSRLRPGSILLFHNDTPHTAKLLPSIISNIKKQGYGFLPVSKMILRENYQIDFEGRQKAK